MPPALYEPMIAKEQFKNIVEIEETIKQLIEVGRRAGLPVLATGNVHYRSRGRNLSRNYCTGSRAGHRLTGPLEMGKCPTSSTA
jgi:DNA polymerase III alpha subunit (gram-positive type)